MLNRPKVVSLILAMTLATSYMIAQDKGTILLWSETRKLTTDDFMIKTKQVEATSSSAQFSLQCKISGLDFMTKNFNRKVQNQMIRTASWIDTTTNAEQHLAYQQSLFDMMEIYTRQLRKALRENRKKLTAGMKIVDDLQNQYLTDFAQRRVDYDLETRFGTDTAKQGEWEIKIKEELAQLGEYSYEK